VIKETARGVLRFLIRTNEEWTKRNKLGAQAERCEKHNRMGIRHHSLQLLALLLGPSRRELACFLEE
jgi:hypothetical protein